jgi:hypothetical protein
MTRIVDLIHTRGDTFDRLLNLNESVLSFDEVWFTVRVSLPDDNVTDDSDVLSSGTLTGGEITQSGARQYSVTIETPDWPVGRLVYDVQVRTIAGQIFTAVRGNLKVYADVTRSV